jgi:hypothetical protein
MPERRLKTNSTFKKSTNVSAVIADDQVIIFNTEDNLQKAAYKLNNNRTQLNYIFRENKTNGI